MSHDYDSTIARIAGNILSGYPNIFNLLPSEREMIAKDAVALARAIVEEARQHDGARTETVTSEAGAVPSTK